MIQSMTGYGAGRCTNERHHVTAELKAVNHKFLEISLRLPSHYLEQEVLLRQRLTERLSRGKIYLQVTVEALTDQQPTATRLNAQVIEAYYEELVALSTRLGAKPKLKLTDLLSVPGAMQDSAPVVDEAEWEAVQTAIDAALVQFETRRTEEGQALIPSFEAQCEVVEERLAELEPYEASRIDVLKAKLDEGLKQLELTQHIGSERYQQEVFFYLEKYDIAEEKARIRAHLAAFRQTLHDKNVTGKRLLFLSQELWREVNTLGNKAYDATIQAKVVDMKEALERIKEQVQNIV